MAKKRGVGPLSDPVRPARRNPKKEGGRPGKQNLVGTTKQQDAIINQTQQGDLALAKTANEQMPEIKENFQTPFNWSGVPQAPTMAQWGGPPVAPNLSGIPGMGNSTDFSRGPQAGQAMNWQGAPGPGQATSFSNAPGLQYSNMQGAPGLKYTNFNRAPGLQYTDMQGLPQGPVTGDFNQWRQGQIDSTYQDFARRQEPQFKQQSEDFEQQMADRGIPQGSKLYDQQKAQLQQSQNDARSSAMVQAQGIAGQNAGQFAQVGFQNAQQAMDRGQMGFGQSIAGRSLFGQEGQQRFGQTLAGRDQYGQEGDRSFGQSLAGRQQHGAEGSQMFGEQNQLRANAGAEQAQTFQQQGQLRDQYGREGAQNFTENMARNAQGMANAGQQFAMEGQAYGMGRDDANARYAAGRQYRGDQIGDQMLQRDMPLMDYQKLMSAQSAQQGQNLDFSHQMTLQNDAQKYDASRPRGGGGGGAADPYMGQGSLQGLWAAQDARARENAMWAQQFEQQNAPDEPNPFAQLAGNAFQSIAGGWAGAGFPKFW